MCIRDRYKETKNPNPKNTTIGQRKSPRDTPKAKEMADLVPPETVRAISAIQTGPGVRNNIIRAPK